MIDLLVKIDVHLRRAAKFLSRRPEKQTAGKVEQPEQQSIALMIHKFPGQELKYASECTFISLLRAEWLLCLSTDNLGMFNCGQHIPYQFFSHAQKIGLCLELWMDAKL